jgi:hypothetical protein
MKKMGLLACLVLVKRKRWFAAGQVSHVLERWTSAL